MITLSHYRARPLSLSALGGLIVLLGLSACSTGMNALVQSAKQVLPSAGNAEAVPLDPQFAYLRVTRGGRATFVWQGSPESTSEGPVEVYYSSGGEVLRLRNGRLVGALGLTTEWRRASVSAPSWKEVAAAPQPLSGVRIRDVMPGYRTGVRDDLRLAVIAPPGRSALRGVDPASLTWFEEEIRSGYRFALPGTASSNKLPAARYAVVFSGDRETVVYSEQCLSTDLCLTWQRWAGTQQQVLAAPQ